MSLQASLTVRLLQVKLFNELIALRNEYERKSTIESRKTTIPKPGGPVDMAKARYRVKMQFLRLQAEGIKIPEGSVTKVAISPGGLIYAEKSVDEMIKEANKIQTQIQQKYSETLGGEEGFLDEIEELKKKDSYFKAFVELDEEDVALSNKFKKAVFGEKKVYKIEKKKGFWNRVKRFFVGEVEYGRDLPERIDIPEEVLEE